MSACQNPACQDAQRHYVAVMRDRDALRAELEQARETPSVTAVEPTEAQLTAAAESVWPIVAPTNGALRVFLRRLDTELHR